MFSHEVFMSKKRRTISRKAQPVEVAGLANAELTIDTVAAVTGRSQSTIYRMVAAGAFPAPRKYGLRCTRWLSADVQAWVAGAAA